MKKGILIIILILNISLVYSQAYIPFKAPEKNSYNFTVDAYKDYLEIVKKRNPSIPLERYEVLANRVAFQKSYFNKQIEYTELNEYLTKILVKLFPQNAEQILQTKVKAVDEVYPNAFTFLDGSFYFTIGLLAEAENEAAIATVLGHEYGHYIYKDAELEFLQGIQDEISEKIDRKKGKNNEIKNLLKSAKFSRLAEIRADSFGFEHASKAGYDIKYAENNFLLFFEMDKFYEKTKDYASISQVYTVTGKSNTNYNEALKDFLSSHPENVDRLNYLKNFIAKRNFGTISNYIIKPENEFKDIQFKCRVEMLRLLLLKNNTYECITTAFKYHLFNPDEPAYIYFLLEGIRKHTFVDNSIFKKGFLSESLTDYLPKKKGVTSKLNLLFGDTTKILQIKATNFLKNVPFDTYQQAFEYFYTKVPAFNNCNECNLSVALYLKSDKNDKYVGYLDKYIKNPGSENIDYAIALKNNGLYTLKKENYLIFDDINYIRKTQLQHADGIKYDYYVYNFERAIKENENNLSQIKFLANQLSKTEKQLVLKELMSTNYNMFTDITNYINYSESYNLALKELYSPEKFSFFEFSPEAWNIANRYNINILLHTEINTYNYLKTINSVEVTLIEPGENRFHYYDTFMGFLHKNISKSVVKGLKRFLSNHEKDHKYVCKFDNH